MVLFVSAALMPPTLQSPRSINSVTYGVAICYEYCFPELFRGCMQLGFEVLF